MCSWIAHTTRYSSTTPSSLCRCCPSTGTAAAVGGRDGERQGARHVTRWGGAVNRRRSSGSRISPARIGGGCPLAGTMQPQPRR
jgi:hypothetical protein